MEEMLQKHRVMTLVLENDTCSDQKLFFPYGHESSPLFFLDPLAKSLLHIEGM